jgi:eukaryotic-like serine/threonine-protein kinase
MANDYETRIEPVAPVAPVAAEDAANTVVTPPESIYSTRTGARETDRAADRDAATDQYATRGSPAADTMTQLPSQPDWPAVENYEILGELGRGGMGVVYKARQVNLRRLVALKMIRTGPYAGPDELLRFRIEAEAVARLQHPNIVQLFEVKEFQGQAFLALELIEGSSLNKSIEFPWPPEHAARLLDSLARAMHYAHEQGIVHRDLKPANILLQTAETRSYSGRAASTMVINPPKHDPHTAIPKITDFGLAKLMSGDSAGPTVSGDFLGTPTYSAPEQASGRIRDIGPHTDVYALGAILYELLTGRPPFQGATVLDTLDQVRSQEPVAPSRLQKKVPRDLETICLKCLQKAPQRRYSSALLLAEDLENFLEGRPIQARPVSTIERVAKAARRRPALALLITSLTLGFILFAIGGWWSAVTLNAANQRESDQRRRAEDNFTQALKAVEKMLMEVGSVDLADVPQMEPVRKKLLLQAKDFYEDFLEKRREDASVRYLAGRAKGRLGDIHEMLGETVAAERSYNEARGLLESANTDPTEQQAELARVSNNLGTLLKQLGRFPDAEKSLREALSVRQRLLEEFPKKTEYSQNLATSWYDLATVLARMPKQRAQAQKAYEQALELQEQLAKAQPSIAKYQLDQARTLNNLGMLIWTVNADLAEVKFRQAIKIQEKLVQKHPKVPEYRRQLARSFNNLATMLLRIQRTNKAEETYQRAGKLLRQLAVDSPTVPVYRQELAGNYFNIGRVYQRAKQFDKADKIYKEALDLRQQLADESPNVPDYQQTLANVRADFGLLLEERGLRLEAEKQYRQAVDLLEKIASSSGRAAYQSDLALVLDHYGMFLMRRAKTVGSLWRLNRLLQAAAGMWWDPEEHPQVQRDLLDARNLFVRAIASQRAALNSDSQNTLYPPLLYGHMQHLIGIQERLRDHQGMAESARALAPMLPKGGESYLLAAESLIVAIPFAATDPRLSMEQRRETADAYARAAVQMLQEALAHGFRDLQKLKTFRVYDPLRNRPDFKRIIERTEDSAPRIT